MCKMNTVGGIPYAAFVPMRKNGNYRNHLIYLNHLHLLWESFLFEVSLSALCRKETSKMHKYRQSFLPGSLIKDMHSCICSNQELHLDLFKVVYCLV